MTSVWRRDTWSLELVTQAQGDVLTLQEAKKQCRVDDDFTDDDDYLRALLIAVRDWAEGETGKTFLTQTYTLHLDRFPYGRRIYLPRPPLQSVSSVLFRDINGNTQTLATSAYAVVGARTTPDQHAPCGYILPAYSTFWPVTYPMPDTVQITYIGGFTSVESIPQRVKQAMLIMLADLYENRERIVTGASTMTLDTVEMLLANERSYQDFVY